MEDLGKVFREFRISKNYSLKEAAGEACSTSQLSRFELGESDLAVSRDTARSDSPNSKRDNWEVEQASPAASFNE